MANEQETSFAQEQAIVSETVKRASPVDDGLLDLLRRHSGKGTVCCRVSCHNDNPACLKVIGRKDQYGFVNMMMCTLCGMHMSTRCSDNVQRLRMRVYSPDEMQPGDHIAWHRLFGHWHNAILVKAEENGRVPGDGKAKLSVINYVFSGCRFRICESIFELDLFVDDVYLVEYTDAYTREYSLKRARRLTQPNVRVNVMTGGCEDVAQWCKTGQRQTRMNRIRKNNNAARNKKPGKKDAGNKHLTKTKTFMSMGFTEGVIPDSHDMFETIEKIMLTAIPVFVFFFSIALEQLKTERKEIKPRPENIITKRSRSRGCFGYCDRMKMTCRTYAGPLWHCFIAELIGITIPVLVFRLVDVYLGPYLPPQEFVHGALEFLGAVLVMPLACFLGAIIGLHSERLFSRCLMTPQPRATHSSDDAECSSVVTTGTSGRLGRGARRLEQMLDESDDNDEGSAPRGIAGLLVRGGKKLQQMLGLDDQDENADYESSDDDGSDGSAAQPTSHLVGRRTAGLEIMLDKMPDDTECPAEQMNDVDGGSAIQANSGLLAHGEKRPDNMSNRPLDNDKNGSAKCKISGLLGHGAISHEEMSGLDELFHDTDSRPELFDNADGGSTAQGISGFVGRGTRRLEQTRDKPNDDAKGSSTTKGGILRLLGRGAKGLQQMLGVDELLDETHDGDEQFDDAEGGSITEGISGLLRCSATGVGEMSGVDELLDDADGGSPTQGISGLLGRGAKNLEQIEDEPHYDAKGSFAKRGLSGLIGRGTKGLVGMLGAGKLLDDNDGGAEPSDDADGGSTTKGISGLLGRGAKELGEMSAVDELLDDADGASPTQGISRLLGRGAKRQEHARDKPAANAKSGSVKQGISGLIKRGTKGLVGMLGADELLDDIDGGPEPADDADGGSTTEGISGILGRGVKGLGKISGVDELLDDAGGTAEPLDDADGDSPTRVLSGHVGRGAKRLEQIGDEPDVNAKGGSVKRGISGLIKRGTKGLVGMLGADELLDDVDGGPEPADDADGGSTTEGISGILGRGVKGLGKVSGVDELLDDTDSKTEPFEDADGGSTTQEISDLLGCSVNMLEQVCDKPDGNSEGVSAKRGLSGLLGHGAKRLEGMLGVAEQLDDANGGSATQGNSGPILRRGVTRREEMRDKPNVDTDGGPEPFDDAEAGSAVTATSDLLGRSRIRCEQVLDIPLDDACGGAAQGISHLLKRIKRLEQMLGLDEPDDDAVVTRSTTDGNEQMLDKLFRLSDIV